MEKVLDKMNNTNDVKNLNKDEKIKLSEDIRKLIINVVSEKWRTFGF